MALDNQYLPDPYNQQQEPQQQETKPLDEVIRQAINAALLDIHTWQPAQITKVRGNNFVDIQPCLLRTYQDGTQTELPQIQNVMVGLMQGADYWIKAPLKVGDYGIALFAERALASWIAGGGIVDPQSARHHEIADCVFIPGVRPMSQTFTSGEPEDMVLHNGLAEIYLQKGGTFKITNGTNELLSTLDDLLTALQNALVLTALGPQPFIAATQTALSQVKTKLESLTGE